MNRRWLFFGVVALMLGLSWYWASIKPAISIRTALVERGDVELTVSNTRAGSVKACRRSGLSMPIGGRVEALHVAEGDSVEAGAILLELWNDDREAQVAQARAQVSATTHRRSQLCVEAENALREAKRLVSLHERGIASLEVMEAARTRGFAAEYACEAARNEAEIAVSGLELQLALLAETQLKAPFAGIVAEITGEVGEYVTPSPPGVATPPAVDLIDYNCVYVTAPIDEVDAGRLKPGLSARVSLDAFRGQTFAAELTRIAPYVLELQKQARTVGVDLQLVDAANNSALLVGYSADVDVVLDVSRDTLRVPTELVLEGDHVYRYQSANGTVEKISITVGLRNWNYTEVTGGLSEGDAIVVSLDAEGLVDGAAAVVIDDSP
jgi:HlyD family secretion protein